MIRIFCDGSCKPNPSPNGGWAFVAVGLGIEKSGPNPLYPQRTTNQRMELLAATRALEWARDCDYRRVEITTDSEYVQLGMRVWKRNWKKHGWKTARGRPIPNRDLWIVLDDVSAFFEELHWQWIAGHSGHEHNEHVDCLAGQQAEALKKQSEK